MSGKITPLPRRTKPAWPRATPPAAAPAVREDVPPEHEPFLEEIARMLAADFLRKRKPNGGGR